MLSKNKIIVFCIFIFSFIYSINSYGLVGIIIPMHEESSLLQKSITEKNNISIAGINYVVGKIQNKKVVFVISGLGKVNSAMIATRLIRDFKPDLVLLSGSSGNINPALKKGDVVIGEKVANVDLGELTPNGIQFQAKRYLRNPNTNTLLPLEFNLDPRWVKWVSELPNNQPKVILGNIATSDALPNLEPQIQLLKKLKFDAIEMEGASVMQACWMFKTSCIIIRGISNNANEYGSITDQDTALAGDNAAKVLMEIIKSYKN